MGSTWLKSISLDAGFIYRIVKSYALTVRNRRINETVNSAFEKVAHKTPNNPCFYYNNDIWTYKRVEETSNRIGNYFQQQGFKKGDVVSLFMSNRIEVVTTWLGLSQIGVITALVNFNLVSDGLKYSIETVKPKAIITGYELSKALGNVYPEGNSSVPIFCTGIGDRNILSKATDIDIDIGKVSTDKPKPSSSINHDDPLVYIYTSGTTGLPKAAIVKHSRMLTISQGLYFVMGFKPKDVLYTSFPLQHSAAGLLVVGLALHKGIPALIRPKFAASEFWKDCIKYKVTCAQYIGETQRYLLKQPITPEETKHYLRMMFGNGLRPELWTKFQERFKIPLICEMYGSTEGNANMFNYTGHPKSIGHIPPVFQNKFSINIIKLDDDYQPIRDPKTGLCVKAGVGEPGEIVGQIIKGIPVREYEGYAGDEENSRKKILKDVLKKGDTCFRSGDMCVRDEEGYYYFKDRIGDTFRFKGENVSTAEVEGVINKICHHDIIVFGIKVPGVDGSTGMAAIADPENSLDLTKLAEGIVKDLPNYSRPRFLRITQKIENTETHKLKKLKFQKQGYDFTKIGNDKIYFFHEKHFIPLTPELSQQINSGNVKL